MAITNCMIHEAFLRLREDGRDTSQNVVEMCRTLFKCDIPECRIKSVYNKVLKTHKKVCELNKNKLSKQRLIFLDEKFALPLPLQEIQLSRPNVTETERKLKEDLKQTKSEHKTLKRKYDAMAQDNENLQDQLDDLMDKYDNLISNLQKMSFTVSEKVASYKHSASDAKHKLSEVNAAFELKIKELDKIQELYCDLKGKQSKECTRNFNKKIKRRDDKIEKMQAELTNFKMREKELNEREENVNKKSIGYADMNDKLRKLQFKISFLKRKNVNNNESMRCTITELEKKCEMLERENTELNQLIELVNDEEIVTFENGKYTDEVRETIMELLALNVSMNKVNDVIRTVVKKLTNKSIGRLPANAVKSRILVEARHLAQVHVAEAMLDGGINAENGNCLHGDGTSKFHKHYQNFQITLASGRTLSLGLKEVCGGDTATVMQSFKDTIQDLTDSILNEKGNNGNEQQLCIEKLISSIKCTMSDRGSVNPCFNKQLQMLRESFLPNVIGNWNTLTTEKKSALSEMCNFFCKMHLLPNMATETDKVIKVFEEVALLKHDNKFAFKTDESGTARLVRTAAKAFHPSGSDEAGVASYFQSYLAGKDVKLKIVPYRGNRFNILYFDAGATYYHRNHITDFLKQWPNPNNLLKAVKEDVENQVHLAGLRALGIVDKIITGPYWRILETPGSILDLNPYLLQMKLSLEEWCKDASGLLEGDKMFSDIEIHEDEIYTELLKSGGDEMDSLTVQCLEMIMHSLLLIVERQAEEQLPGGKYCEPSETMKNAAKNVPKSNKVSEREFASLDLLIRMKPKATVMAKEAIIMWTHNKTSDWLSHKTEDERKKILQDARENYDSVVEKFKTRRDQLKAQRMDKLVKKQEEKAKTENRKQTLKIKTTEELVHQGTGVWKSKEDVQKQLEKCHDEKTKRNLVVTQIRFHKNVLKSKGDSQLFSFSTSRNKKRVQHNLQTLTEHLLKIIELNPVNEEIVSCAQSIRPVETRKEFFALEKEKLKQKLSEQRDKLKISKEKEKLNIYVKDINLLLNKQIKHKCSSDDGIEWFDGVVLDVKTWNKDDPIKTEYWIHYTDDDNDTKWFFPLLMDLKAGDLIIFD